MINLSNDLMDIALGNGDGTFTLSESIEVGADPLGLALGDANGDNWLDILASNLTADTVGIALRHVNTSQSYSYDLAGNRIGGSIVIGPGNRLMSDADYTYEYDWSALENLIQVL